MNRNLQGKKKKQNKCAKNPSNLANPTPWRTINTTKLPPLQQHQNQCRCEPPPKKPNMGKK